MANKQVQIRKGTTAENDAFTGAIAEMSYDSSQKRMRVHDGVTLGGFPLALKSEVDSKQPLLGFTPANQAGDTFTGDVNVGPDLHLDTDGSASFAGGDILLNTDGSVSFSSGVFSISSLGLITFPDGVRQIFNPNGTNAGINVGAVAGDPSAPVNGDIWYDSGGNLLRARINGATVSLGGSGSSPPFDDGTAIVKGSADATKLLRFEVDGFTAATTRVLTPPNADATIAGLELAQTFTALNTLSANGIGATQTDRLQLSNTTAAAPGAQQYSPAIRFTGQGWKLNAVAASQAVDYRMYCQPVQGSAAPTGNLLIDVSVNGAAFLTALILTSGGLLIAPNIQSSGNLTLASTGRLDFGATRSQIRSSADGILELFNAAVTGFTRLNFGGTTSSFPAIKRNGATFDFRLADDSAYAGFTSGNHTFAVAALLSITSGTNQRAGNATLVAGTVTVSNTTVTANTIVLLTRKTSGGTIGTAITYTVSAGSSFTINSDSALDTSTFSYLLIEVP